MDTLNLFLAFDFVRYKEKFQHIIRLFNQEPTISVNKINKEEYYRGNIKNLLILINHNSLTVIGSICKFYYGTNQKTLTYTDLLDAILKLEELLDVELDNATVTRIDLAENLLMENKPESYYSLLIKGGFLKRREDDNGLYYRSGNRAICIYDKLVQEKQSKNTIEVELEGENVLRYEFRMKNNREISKRLGVTNARLIDVINNYGLLVWYWCKSFDLIPKDIEIEMPSKTTFSTVTEFKNYLAGHGLKYLGGYGRVINMIHEAKSRGVFNYPAQSSNLKTMVKELVSKLSGNNAPEMLVELENRLKESMAGAIMDYWQISGEV